LGVHCPDLRYVPPFRCDESLINSVNFLIGSRHDTALGGIFTCTYESAYDIAVLIAIYSILFLLMSSCFFRLVFVGPSYIPRPQDDPEKSAAPGPDPTTSADIFVCEPGGYPRWCRTCKIIKPDRAHHSSDAGRCVYKMGISSFTVS
jgi:DHHC palmitoyltransferase